MNPFSYLYRVGTLQHTNPEKPDPELIQRAAEVLKSGGLVIYPTDTIYGIGCDIESSKGLESLSRVQGIDLAIAHFSVICPDLSHLAGLTRPIPNHLFRILKKALPGPYTFILEAGTQVPKTFRKSKKTIGIRIPDNPIPRMLAEALGRPVLNSSIKDMESEFLDYGTDPEQIFEQYREKVDLMISGGYGGLIPSTIIDASGDEMIVVREGAGDVSGLL